ncbi:hypothetical protein ACFL17_10625 [Pseudomonadota bacterium]
MRFRKLAFVFSIVLLAGCGGGSPGISSGGDTSTASNSGGTGTPSNNGAVSTPANVNIAGNWRGSYSTSLIPAATITYSITQTGNRATATYRTSTSVSGTATGVWIITIIGNRISFAANQTSTNCPGNFSGTGVVNGNATSMTYTFTGTDCAGVHNNGKGVGSKQ